MIKGDSRLPVVGAMAMCVQLLLIRFEWVDSDSNFADGLSRDGAEDSWTLKHNWDLHEFQGFPFAISLVTLREHFPEFSHWGCREHSLADNGTYLGAATAVTPTSAEWVHWQCCILASL